MRAQILLQEGPFDLHLISYDSHFGRFSNEMRVGSTDVAQSVAPEDFEAAVYRKGEIEKMKNSGNMYFGNYVFIGMRQTAFSLVDVWMT